MNKFYIFLSALILAGCGGKPTSALNHFENDPVSANAIQYTRKGDITYQNKINSMLFGTYLNNIDKKYENEEKNSFVVGIHLVNKDNHDFKENGYEITLNDKAAVEVTNLENDSTLVKSIPLKNLWGKYYLIKFKNDKKERNLNLSLSHPTFGSTVLKFQK